MRVLYVTTIGMTMNFFKPFIRKLIDEGHEVDIATNETESAVPDCFRKWGCTVFQIDTSRSPANKGNLIAIKQIKKLVDENKYNIVHCHTPVAAMCTRLACHKARKNGVKVFYTAHGFHFYKGAPLKNWLIYYPVEKLCAHYTDKLITINQEDFALAKRKMKAKEVEYVPGVGIDLNHFQNVSVDKLVKRRELGIPDGATVLLSVGELNENKNHQVVIRALAHLGHKDVHYIIAGTGTKKENLKQLALSLKLSEHLHLLGYRDDIAELLAVADCFVFPSYREGLSVSLMEAMAVGLPCVVSRIRGNTDLIDLKGGAYFNPNSIDECCAALKRVLEQERDTMAIHNQMKIQKFSMENVLSIMNSIYNEG